MGFASSSRCSKPAVAFVLFGCALGLAAGTTGATAAPADTSSLTITYTTATSLQITLADGTVVKTGSVIPAGAYLVNVIDDPVAGDVNPNIRISGPGVSLSSNLNTGMGIVNPSAFGPFTFQPSSSYSIEDSNLGPSSLVSFATASTSAAVGSTKSSSPNSSGSSSPSAPVPTQTQTQTQVQGTLSGSISSAGVATLMVNGKAVTKVSAGSYTLTVENHSRKVGFILEQVSKQPIAIIGAGAIGRHSKAVRLTPGKWLFEGSSAGPKHYFSVVA